MRVSNSNAMTSEEKAELSIADQTRMDQMDYLRVSGELMARGWVVRGKKHPGHGASWTHHQVIGPFRGQRTKAHTFTARQAEAIEHYVSWRVDSFMRALILLSDHDVLRVVHAIRGGTQAEAAAKP